MFNEEMRMASKKPQLRKQPARKDGPDNPSRKAPEVLDEISQNVGDEMDAAADLETGRAGRKSTNVEGGARERGQR